MGLPVPSKYKITTPYGKPGKHWACGHHTGVDFAAPQGTPITAIADGKVLEAKAGCSWGGAYGNAVIIDHGNGYHVMYAHMSQILIKKGAKVTEGQLIGKVGNTGNSFGAHLHLEARVSPWLYGNKDVNPAVLLSGVKTSLKAKLRAKKPSKRDTGTVHAPDARFPGKPFGPGATGSFVKLLQEKLGVPVTGKFDDATKAAVIKVQKANKDLQPANGIVGPMTWAKITGQK
jgi:hypothetical protein